MHRREGQRADRLNPIRLQPRHELRKARLGVDGGNHQGLLVLIHPPGQRLVARHVRQRHHARLELALQGAEIVLGHRRVIEGEPDPVPGDHLAQFPRQHPKQGRGTALRREQADDAEQGRIARGGRRR